MIRCARAALAALLSLAFVATAPAAAYADHCDADSSNYECHGDPVVTSPGGEVAAGYTGPLTVDFAATVVDTYLVDISPVDGGSYGWSGEHYYDGVDTAVSFTIDPIPAGQYDITVSGLEFGHQTVQTLVVVAGSLVLDHVTASPQTFYPLVRDGYRDSTRATYRVNQSARVIARVFNSSATKVLGVDLGVRSGSQTWSWSGKKSDGTYAVPGSYVVRFYATAGDLTKQAGVVVKIATSYTVVDTSKVVTGYQTYSHEFSPSCYVDYFYYYSTVDLDCWGGSYAIARYRFTIPANAYNVRYAVAGYHECCTNGDVYTTAARTSSTVYRVNVVATGWRSYVVERVRVGYTYRKRI